MNILNTIPYNVYIVGGAFSLTFVIYGIRQIPAIRRNKAANEIMDLIDDISDDIIETIKENPQGTRAEIQNALVNSLIKTLMQLESPAINRAKLTPDKMKARINTNLKLAGIPPTIPDQPDLFKSNIK